jgi:NADH-quinone oxidoreductase subunit B
MKTIEEDFTPMPKDEQNKTWTNIANYFRANSIWMLMYEPKYLVAFGPCTLNGGIYHDSHAVINRLDQYLPIDLYIAGCMPKPEAVMNGFQDLIQMIQDRKATGWKMYQENHAWYQENQIAALGEVFVHDEFHE